MERGSAERIEVTRFQLAPPRAWQPQGLRGADGPSGRAQNRPWRQLHDNLPGPAPDAGRCQSWGSINLEEIAKCIW